MVLHVLADNLREGLIQNGRNFCWRHEHCPGILLEAKIFRKSHLPSSQGCQRVNLWRARYKRRSGITDAGHQQKWLHQRKCRGEIPREIITNEFVKSCQNYKNSSKGQNNVIWSTLQNLVNEAVLIWKSFDRSRLTLHITVVMNDKNGHGGQSYA